MTRRRRRGTVATIALAVGLLVSLAGWGWFASEQAREGWWALGQHVAVGPDERGWAGDTVGIRLAGVATVPEVEEERPPAGFTYLELDFEVAPAGPAEQEAGQDAPLLQLTTCEVQVRDEAGRLFQAGREVPSADPYESSLRCGTSDPAEDPVPTRQSLLVLLPVDAEPVSVRVDAHQFPAATFIELPLPS